MSRGPPGGDRDRGAGPPGRPGWNDRPKSQEKNQDDKDTKRSASRWAVTESSSPTVVSDEEDWEDDDVIQPETKKTEQLAPLPQTEPIDDDSQEDDFNDFEDDAASVELDKPPVAIVEIGDDSSSSSVEELPNAEATEVASQGSGQAPEDEAAATPLYDEPENKDKTPAESSQSQDEPIAEDGDVQGEGHNHTSDVDGEDQQDDNEAADYVSEDPEQNSHSNERCDDVISNVDADENRSNQSNDDRTSRPDEEDHNDNGVDREEDDVEEARCPTPDAHIESDNEEDTESSAPQTSTDAIETNDREEDDDDDGSQSD